MRDCISASDVVVDSSNCKGEGHDSQTCGTVDCREYLN